jgi:alpha-galactosidase
MLRDLILCCLAVLLLLSLRPPAWGEVPSPSELTRARRWSSEHFRRARRASTPTSEAQPGLLVLANHDRVLINGRPDGRPLQIADTKFAHGLLCHAVSKVVVRLPAPGRTFRATVGVDANAGGGSIVFSVRVGATEAFRSQVMQCGEPGVPVEVDVGGAREFTLEVGDAGDGISCDHADWAEARVTLTDGTEVGLSDLPLLSPQPRPRTAAAPPFSFVYDGRHSDELLADWRFTQSVDRLDAQRTRRTQTYTDPKTGLEVRCVIVEYADFPVVEWTLYLKNTGAEDTPVLEDIQALDARFGRPTGEFVLHHNVGSPCQPNDYEPLTTPLAPGAQFRLSAAGGRPTNSDLCYFNLQSGSEGQIIALGWPGQWAAQFTRGSSEAVRVTAGQELTRFRLHPGEEVRTPLVALLFWGIRGHDPIRAVRGLGSCPPVCRAQNLWRQWMIAHNLPRPGGQPVPQHYGACFGNLQPRADEELAVIDGFAREGVKLAFWFLDAGWYPDQGGWWNVGTWEPDPERFPRGVREVSDRAHAHGMQFVLWFEPERVAAGSWLAQNRPEWVLGGAGGGLLNLGDPAAWRWVVDRMDSLITSQGVDVYRQDFNIDPLPHWRGNDSEDRQGITEIKHVTGYLALWDELLRRHPGLWIDTCASGGRRNDLETLRRSVPLLRSDYWNDPAAQQAQTMGIAPWMPYFGSGMSTSDLYWFRSCIFPASRIGWDARDPTLDYPFLKRMIDECRLVQQYLMGDFYPLTPYSLATDVWFAWQFHRPDLDAGVVQAFRRADCPTDAVTLHLHGLDPHARYLVTDLDNPTPQEFTGEALMTDGLPLTTAARPAGLLLRYERER